MQHWRHGIVLVVFIASAWFLTVLPPSFTRRLDSRNVTTRTTRADAVGIAVESSEPTDTTEAAASIMDQQLDKRDATPEEQTRMMQHMKDTAVQRSLQRLRRLFGRSASQDTVFLLCQKFVLVSSQSDPDRYAADPTNTECRAAEHHNELSPGKCRQIASNFAVSLIWPVSEERGKLFADHDACRLYHEYVREPVLAHVQNEMHHTEYLYRKRLIPPTSTKRIEELNSTVISTSSEGVCIPRDFADMATVPPTMLNVSCEASALQWSSEELRVALLVDLDATIEKAAVPEDMRRHLERGLLCMQPKLRAVVAFARHNGWLFERARPPLTEADVTDTVLDEQVSNTSLTFSAAFNYKNVKMLKRSLARNNPVFFSLKNAILSSHSGSGPPQAWGIYRKQSFDLLRDERWIRIREFFAVPRKDAPPRFLVRQKQLFLFPVIFASSNIGHVMFRYYSVLQLLHSMRFPVHNSVVAYVAVPSAALTFGPHNKLRTYYQAAHGPWVSLLSATSFGVRSSDLDMCFADGLTGFGGIAQFHLGRQAPMIAARTASAAKLRTAVQRVRQLSLDCLQIPNYNTPRPTDPARPRLIVIVQRRRRRLMNEEELLSKYLERASAAASESGATDVYVDPRTNISFRVRTVNFEFMTIRQQVATAMDADVLFGPLGAGHCWMMYMRPLSAVVELHSSISMRCTGVGINADRMRCDYSKQSTAVNLNHIGFPMEIRNWCMPLMCDGYLSQESFDALLATALCTVGKSEMGAAQLCRKWFPTLSPKAQSNTTDPTAATEELAP